MRARYPDTEGFIERDGVKVGYEVFGAGEPAVVFPPIDGIVHSRCWKAQVPYLARFFKVVTIDPRGNGRSDRPQSARPTPTPSGWPTRSRSWTRPASTVRSWSGCAPAAGVHC